LTPREQEVLQLLARGLSNKEIAQRLTISPRTVNFHLDNIYSKLHVNSRTAAVIAAMRQGLVRRPG
jgi:DNA-binding NarL/FixJ family response regulator